MSGFAIVNLMELEDGSGGRVPGLEARFGRRHLGSEHIGVSHQRYGANVRSRMGHSHREQEEVYVVVAGSGRVLLDGEPHDIRQWDVVRVSPPVVRAFGAGADGLELIAIGSDRPEGGDGVAGEAAWPD